MSRYALMLFFSFLVRLLWAQQEQPMSAEDRLFDLEARVTSLKAELEATKSLATQERANIFNPSISVVGDFIGQYGFNLKEHHHDHDGQDHKPHHNHAFKNGILLREIEFEFRADVDPYADAAVVVALEPHDVHHVDVHVEEAFMRLKKWPGLGYAPLGMTIKAGKFRTALGRMNRIHMHNIPQITYPLALKTFLGDEGHSAPGISINWGFNPTKSSALNIFAETIFNSRLKIQEKGAENMANGVFHAWWHQELSPAHTLDLGLSSLVGRKGGKKSGTLWLLGGDVHYSYIPEGSGQNPLFLLGSEIYAANKRDGAGRWPLGNFTWAQVNLFGSAFLGARYDIAPQEEDMLEFQHALGAYIGYYTTEFLRFRFGYEHVMPEINSFAGDHRFMLSTIFIFGSHPAEPYFVNR